MRQHYAEAGDWWEGRATPGLQDTPLPDDLLEGFRHIAGTEGAAEEARP
jgi:hypothetical protein